MSEIWDPESTKIRNLYPYARLTRIPLLSYGSPPPPPPHPYQGYLFTSKYLQRHFCKKAGHEKESPNHKIKSHSVSPRAYMYSGFAGLDFCVLSSCRKDQFAISYFSTSLIVLIQVYNWEIQHHSLVCCCGLQIFIYLTTITRQLEILEKISFLFPFFFYFS